MLLHQHTDQLNQTLEEEKQTDAGLQQSHSIDEAQAMDDLKEEREDDIKKNLAKH